ncbi:TlpA family protein disulfide reductase [Flavobacterium cerinum]|uniref:TlpA family protein disulfide reductase n=1 Tax=Flavobacterium cerinum TaxID=2502784 RepID=A0ABY5IPQ6_9FLAO|nr:TlpA disulfide reductase family protein [Flavobacterium cerinum]UUC44182.1 TlpA family protein disulfide reductase [Flavobacterium cerinum]
MSINDSGHFSQNIKIENRNTYASFEMQDNRISSSTGRYYNLSQPERANPLNELYLFENGDSVKVLIQKNNSLTFRGKGSEKLNCQYQIFNLFSQPKIILSRAIALENKSELHKAIQLEITSIKAQKSQLEALLSSYSSKLGKDIYEQISLDAISLLKQQIYYKLPNYYLRFPSQKEQELVRSYFQSVDSLDFDETFLSEDAKARSAYYTAMLLEREVTKLILFKENRNSYKDFSFDELFNNIKNGYTGLVRDNLILLSFENYAIKKADDIKRMYKPAHKTVNNQVIKEQLTRLIEKYNAPAFPFVFYDAENNPHRLQDYKGKVIVMDFWFTGCVPCTMVAKAMHPIFEKYKKRNDIVFITVSTDPRERWLKSIASGQYTSNGMINLYTNGKGFNAPMIAYYKFAGFPQQLIIDKNGDLITARPPRPDESNSNVVAFEKLIMKSLNK